MKQHLLALSLGLAATLAGTSALANTGMINFEGMITSSTCPIEVVNPGDGSVGNLVKMGTLEASRFTAVNNEYDGKPFNLRISGVAGCSIGATSKARVTFNGTADTSGSYFSVTQTADDATGVVISIRDKNTGTLITPGAATADYDLEPTGTPTELQFHAYYRQTATSVIPGVASADVQFVVAIN